jgi:hypothetical protein
MDAITAQDSSQVSVSAMDAVHCLCPVDSSQCRCVDDSRHSHPAQCDCLNDPDPIHRLCLAGLKVLPIPPVDKITDVFKQADAHHDQLATSNQDTLIYRNATTAHLDALAAHIDTTNTKALANYHNALNSNDSDHTAARRNYYNTISTYPGLITFFGNDSGLLFFKMSSIVDSSAQDFLYRQIIIWGGQMGLQLGNFASSERTYKQKDQQKQTHSSVQPLPLRWSVNHFPTLVMEGGNNQAQLRRDKDWWFDNSPPDQPQGDVKMVALIKVEGPAKGISIELWDRHHTQVQIVTIAPHPEESLSTEVKPPYRSPLESSRWVVKGGPLVIPFERVFLRPKAAGETDLVIDEPTFVIMARQVWQRELPIV